MKKIHLLLALLFLATVARSQGIQFESAGWKDVVAKAKKAHRLIYMDIYTTWCGPCKVMAAQVFPNEKAGSKYNDLFVNYKIDAEKGEGIDLAKKYEVNGYPTNLYINPETEEIVYRVMGSTDVPEFLHRADVAIQEQKDPMNWPDYEQKFAKGNADKAFLVAYLDKAERLNKQNDKALNSYVEKYAGKSPDDATILFLIQHTKTFDNKSVAVLAAHQERINKLKTDPEDYFTAWSSSLPYNTLEKAIENKDEKLLTVIDSGLTKYKVKSGMPSGMYFYKKEYYSKTGDTAKAWKAGIAEADYLTALPAQDYATLDNDAMANIRSSIIYQLKGMNVPQEKFESSIEATLDKHPEMRKSATMNAAGTLNETAWKVFESKRADKQALSMAIKWSGRAAMMAEGTDSWPLFADTYASLMYANGEKGKAIVMEESAIKKAEETKMEGVDSLKETLEKMKAGKL
jgi:thiol-disulfide isomerase/thioredoxin